MKKKRNRLLMRVKMKNYDLMMIKEIVKIRISLIILEESCGGSFARLMISSTPYWKNTH